MARRQEEVKTSTAGERNQRAASKQWQIEAFRRIEIPEEMGKKWGFAPLGRADGPVKTAIFGGNARRLYNLPATAERPVDRVTLLKERYGA